MQLGQYEEGEGETGSETLRGLNQQNGLGWNEKGHGCVTS